MSRKLYGAFLVAFAVLCLVGLPSCGRDQQLISITLEPPVETFGAATIPVNLDQGLSVQLRALATYAHPPVTKDITNAVTWNSNTPSMVTVNATGLITATGQECGNTLVSATAPVHGSSGDIITGYMTANVVCFTGGGVGGIGPIVTVSFPGKGTGIVTSTPAGLGCSLSCSASFATGTTVMLTATATGTSVFGGWSNCDSVSGQVCTLNNLNANRTVSVTFN